MDVEAKGGLGRWTLCGGRSRGRLVVLFFAILVVSGCAPKVQVAYQPRQRAVQQSPVPNDQAAVLSLKRHYEKWRGTPYVDGGMSPSGIDCSGYTVVAYRDLFGLELPRTAGEQAARGREIPRRALQSGDLVFFRTGRYKNHVGIYLHDDQFVHASLSRGVTLSSLDDPYWQERYWQSRRLGQGDGGQSSPGGNLAMAGPRR